MSDAACGFGWHGGGGCSADPRLEVIPRHSPATAETITGINSRVLDLVSDACMSKTSSKLRIIFSRVLHSSPRKEPERPSDLQPPGCLSAMHSSTIKLLAGKGCRK